MASRPDLTAMLTIGGDKWTNYEMLNKNKTTADNQFQEQINDAIQGQERIKQLEQENRSLKQKIVTLKQSKL